MARKGGKNLQLSGKRPRPEGAAASLSSRPEDAGSPDRGCRGFGCKHNCSLFVNGFEERRLRGTLKSFWAHPQCVKSPPQSGLQAVPVMEAECAYIHPEETGNAEYIHPRTGNIERDGCRTICTDLTDNNRVCPCPAVPAILPHGPEDSPPVRPGQ